MAGSGQDKIEPSNPPKDPVLMAVLSLLFTGLGQIVIGQVGKGIAVFCGALCLGILFACAGLVIIIPFFFIPLIPVVAAVDAYLIANKLKEGKAVGQWEFF